MAILTLVLLNTDLSIYENTVDPDQLASSSFQSENTGIISYWNSVGELDKHWGRVAVNKNILHNKYMLSFCQKLFILNKTPSCICSMCLHCIGKVSNFFIKSCGRSWSAHEGTTNVYTKDLSWKNCLSSHSCHFVKNYFFWTKLLHAYVQCVYIEYEKYQIVPSKAVVGVDQPVYGL